MKIQDYEQCRSHRNLDSLQVQRNFIPLPGRTVAWMVTGQFAQKKKIKKPNLGPIWTNCHLSVTPWATIPVTSVDVGRIRASIGFFEGSSDQSG